MKRVEEFIKKNHMITQGDRVIAGVSGGADSVCLFFVLLELREKLGFELVAVHVNHGLRGEAACQDEIFVKNLCEQHEVPLEVFRVKLESIAKKWKQSLEEAGRIVRRDAFEKTRIKYHANKIALAHHQNDNAETLLWNLSRGTGLDGLGGIRPVNGNYIRPLLCMERREIEAYLIQMKQAYCIDETNAETDYTRNKLRHLVIPILEEQVNSGAVRHMNETMEQLREIQEYLRWQTDQLYRQCVVENEGVIIKGETFGTVPEVIGNRVIRKAIEQVCGKMKDISRIHVEVIRELFGKQVGRSLDLPYGIRARRGYEGICLEIEKEKNSVIKEPILIKIPGETVVPSENMTIRCKIIEKPENFSVNDIPEKVYTKWFDYDIIKRSLYMRTRQTGDTISIDGDGHRKKLKKWFVDEKIPMESREQQLLIAMDQQILWILGHRMSAEHQVGELTKRILQIEVETYKSDGGKKDGRDNS